MLKSPALSGAVIVGAVAIASMFAASPASAATLPSGQRITVVDEYQTTYFTADPGTAALTAAGPDDQTIDGCVEGIDVDDAGLGWAVESAYPYFSFDVQCSNDGAIGAGLWKADANTGLMTDGVQIRIFFGDFYEDADECSAIDFSGGVITAACLIFVGDSEIPVTYVGSVTLDGDVATMVPDFAFGEIDIDPFLYITALAKDPVTGTLYAFTVEDIGEGGYYFGVYTLSTTEGVDSVGSTTDPVWGADFDRGGQLWATTQTDEGDPALATISTIDSSFPSFELYTLNGVDYVDVDDDWIGAITVWGPPALAATGSTISPLAPIGAASVLLLGALLAAGAAMRRRAAQ